MFGRESGKKNLKTKDSIKTELYFMYLDMCRFVVD